MAAAYPQEERERIIWAVFADMKSGKSLTKASEDVGISEATVLRWIDQDETGEWSKEYTRARDGLLSHHAREMLAIVDGTNLTSDKPDYDAAKVRNQLEARKWLYARLMPKRFGDKVQNQHTGPNGAPLAVTYVIPTQKPEPIGYDSGDEVLADPGVCLINRSGYPARV
jgi:transposase